MTITEEKVHFQDAHGSSDRWMSPIIATKAHSSEAYGSVDQLWEAVREAQPQISFWGSRCVRCANGNEPLLARLTDNMLNVCHLDDVDDIPMEQRLKGINVIDRLRDFYTATDDLIGKTNIITEIFFYIREFFGANGTNIYGPRWFLEDFEPRARLMGFTKQQYEQHFPDSSYALSSQSGYISSSRWGGAELYSAPPGTELNP